MTLEPGHLITLGFAGVAAVTYGNIGGAENTSVAQGFQLRWVN